LNPHCISYIWKISSVFWWIFLWCIRQ